MLDVVFIALWLINRSKAKTARSYGNMADAEKYAKRARIFGWIEIAWLVLSVILVIAVFGDSSSSGY